MIHDYPKTYLDNIEKQAKPVAIKKHAQEIITKSCAYCGFQHFVNAKKIAVASAKNPRNKKKLDKKKNAIMIQSPLLQKEERFC